MHRNADLMCTHHPCELAQLQLTRLVSAPEIWEFFQFPDVVPVTKKTEVLSYISSTQDVVYRTSMNTSGSIILISVGKWCLSHSYFI